MESNIVSFILENLVIFLPLVVSGIFITLYLILTRKKTEEQNEKLIIDHQITLLGINLNVFFILYLFIVFMMVVIGVLSNFILPVSIGLIFAFIPVVILVLAMKISNKQG